ncbi:hypothetical protein [Saccharopolyspora sp. NPDC049357]|uniref:hypothetical protein n=1 Tax=Saccharopolyspora sp. NPDC049357 TaxID=3154507 RepID=UPI0034294C3C
MSEDHGLVQAVESQFESWLRGKGSWDPPTEKTGYFAGPRGQELLVVHRDGADGHSLRLRLTETGANGSWRTNLTAHQSADGESWLGLRVENPGGKPAKVPRLAAYLLDALKLHDGGTWLSASPRRVFGPDVEQVAEEVTDVDRQGLYFVAGTDEQLPFDSFANKVGHWTHDTRGMAQVVVLDPAATRQFEEILGPSHAVSPWTIRTFDTDVDPAVPADGRRHRILSTGRLLGRDGTVRSILGRATRLHAVQRPQPARFSPVHRALSRLEDKLLVDDLLPSTTPEPEAGSEVTPVQEPVAPTALSQAEGINGEITFHDGQIELVKEVLGIANIDREALTEIRNRADHASRSTNAIERVTRQLQERLERIEELELERDIMQEASEEQELELAVSLADQAKLADEVRWLRRRLAASGDAENAYRLLPEEETSRYPGDFAELVDMLATKSGEGVVFSGDEEIVRELAEHDTIGRVAGVAWDCVLALCDYVKAREAGDHTHGLRQYLENTPQGYRAVSPKKFAAKETARTMQEWGDQRRFPVPTHVDPTGETVMEAHFKLGKVGMISPRMYYLDNYTQDGKVYIGYIGTHRRNTQTN